MKCKKACILLLQDHNIFFTLRVNIYNYWNVYIIFQIAIQILVFEYLMFYSRNKFLMLLIETWIDFSDDIGQVVLVLEVYKLEVYLRRFSETKSWNTVS